MISRFFTTAVLFTLTTSAAWGGWVVTYQGLSSGKTEQLLIQNGKLARQDTIIKQGTVILIDHASKSYWQGTADAICSWTKQMVAQMSAQMPASMKQQVAKARAGAITREDLGSTTIAGYQASGYRFLMDGRPASEVWVSKDPKPAGLVSETQQAMACANQVSGCMSSPLAQLGVDLRGTKAYQEVISGAFIMKEPTGVHMSMSTTGKGGVEFRFNTVASIEQKDIADSAFEVPAGYQAVADFGALMERMGAR